MISFRQGESELEVRGQFITLTPGTLEREKGEDGKEKEKEGSEKSSQEEGAEKETQGPEGPSSSSSVPPAGGEKDSGR